MKASAVFLMFLLGQSSVAFGHSFLKQALVGTKEIKTGDAVASEAKNLVLVFSSPIELSLSSFVLSRNGKSWQIKPDADSLEVKGKPRVSQVALKIPSLSPGEYLLKWSTFAVDGHRQASSLKFFVKDDG